MAHLNLQFIEQHRNVLRGTGFPFCDDPAHESALTLRQAAHSWGLVLESCSGSLQDLICKGIEASSCDHELQQNIENTLSDDDDFWSSTASGSKHEEYLLYRLASPHSSVHAVRIAVYRARYQLGAPLYPPKTITFEIGFSKTHLQPVPGNYQAQLTDNVQTFILPAQAPVGRYLKITLHGKVQQQFEDRQYYTAIRRVNAWGQCLPSAAMFRASQLISTRQLQLSKILNLPATMYTQLQRYTASARHGVPGREHDAASGVTASQLAELATGQGPSFISENNLSLHNKTVKTSSHVHADTMQNDLFVSCTSSSGLLLSEQTHSL